MPLPPSLHPTPRRIWLTGAALLLAGCAASPPQHAPRMYRLPTEVTVTPPPTPAAPASPATTAATIWELRLPVHLAGHLDRSQLVMRDGPAALRVLDDQRWAEPLRDGIARVLLADLQALAPAGTVVTSALPSGSPAPARRLTVTIDRLDPDPAAQQVEVEARWSIQQPGPAPQQIRWGRTAFSLPARAASTADWVLAQRQALRQLAERLVAEP